MRLYTRVLGFVKKADFSNSGYRWLTIRSEPDRAMFFSYDVKADYDRMKAPGAEFTEPPGR